MSGVAWADEAMMMKYGHCSNSTGVSGWMNANAKRQKQRWRDNKVVNIGCGNYGSPVVWFPRPPRFQCYARSECTRMLHSRSSSVAANAVIEVGIAYE